jgi:urocanate hydratase
MSEDVLAFQQNITTGIPAVLPTYHGRDTVMQHAPIRNISILSLEEKKLALANALRYFPAHHHTLLAEEFAKELLAYGRIYMYRFRPA